MLHGPGCAYLFAEHAKFIFQLQVRPLACENCILQVRVVESVPLAKSFRLM